MPRRRPRTLPTDSASEDAFEVEDSEFDQEEEDQAVEEQEAEVVPEKAKEKPKPAPPPPLAEEKVEAGETVSEEVQRAIDAALSARESIPSGLILGPKEPLRIEGESDGLDVIVSRDIYRVVYPGGSKRPSFVLLHPRGARILKSTLQRI